MTTGYRLTVMTKKVIIKGEEREEGLPLPDLHVLAEVRKGDQDQV